MVSNYYLDETLKSFKNFRGTFSSDNTPLLRNNEGVICNFSRVGEEGTHFVFLTLKNDTLYYFDSLKLNIIPEDVAQTFTNYRNVVNISRRVQHPNSAFCGFYCMLAFLACNLDVDFFRSNILNVFKGDNIENDNVCIKLIKCILPISIKKQ
jgi:hypothetical protein